ncbi:response regulator [Noviherbaspirillum sp.]|mgnify:CR=1 FL=1|jgi:CheY-like chemotaxis protein|uniref:GGDEF domain-containing response regulator n=1 Tax=Noviherbaspirillum sp. TaxID=1926288 RepID=UPI0025DF4FF4|nr:response regulator [Noviherbaspirillum sp.]
MTTQTSIELPAKPRVLIADDSRIVRATLIKHIEGMFDFREALDGEEAWETLLLDPSIRVVITDLTMPKLDGYGLLHRIRSSRISRIRDIPVVVVSGSDEHEERDRAKAAGATDLITKGIGTAQLLSRLDILSKLVTTQHEFERSLEALVENAEDISPESLPSADAARAGVETLLANSVKSRKNFVVLHVCIGLKHIGVDDVAAAPPQNVVRAIGDLLRRTVRQSDHVARSGEAEFILATGSINFDSARCFAQRICRAIASAQLVKSDRMAFIASCGLASLSDDCPEPATVSLQAIQGLARRRAMLGLTRAITGIVGKEEEMAFLRGDIPVSDAREGAVDPLGASEKSGSPDLATLLQWIKEGRQDEVLPHIGKLSAELQPLVDLLLKQNKR